MSPTSRVDVDMLRVKNHQNVKKSLREGKRRKCLKNIEVRGLYRLLHAIVKNTFYVMPYDSNQQTLRENIGQLSQI